MDFDITSQLNSRKALVIGLVVATIVLLVIAVLIGIRLQQSQAPIDTSAACSGAGPCSTTCPDGTSFSDACPANGAFGSCGQWANEACAGHQGGGNTPNPPTPPGNGCSGAKNCSVTCNNNETFSDACPGNGSFSSCSQWQNEACASRGGVKGSGGGNPSCGTAGNSCEPSGCCPSGYDCQGTAGSRICQQHSDCSGSDCACKTSGGACTGYITFHCNGPFGATCNDNPVDGNNSGHMAGCGQIDQVWIGGSCNRNLCGSFTIDRSGCSSSNPPQNPPNPPPNGPTCGDGTKNGSEACDPTASPTGCASGQTCSATCTCSAVPVCGSACTTDAGCPSTAKCSATTHRCELPGCTASTCTNGCIPLCGGPCTTNANCPAAAATCNTTTHKCEVTGSTPETYINGCIPISQCGGPCDPANNNADCPTGHSCDPATRHCAIPSCIGNSSCTNNGCTLPQTALVSDTFDRVLMGGVLLVLGVLAVKFKWIEILESGLAYVQFNYISEEGTTKRKIRKTRDEFEQEFDK